MKRPDDTEIDRLLRRHLRPGGGAARAGENAGAHMDADEMNAYAEGALPEGARARYFAHLADCDSCRQLVTELTLAAIADAEGRERAVAAVTAAPAKSWRERLAAIFSPPVLRYAVPALALFAVVAVALVAMRANRDAAYVARSEQSAPNTGSGVVANANANAGVQPEASPAGVENHATANTDATAVFRGQEGAQPTAAAPSPTPTLAQNPPAEKDGPLAGQATRPEQNVAQSDVTNAASGEDQSQAGGRRAQEEVAAAPPSPPSPKAQEPVLAAPSATDEVSVRDKEEQREAKTARKDDRDDAPAGGAVATETQPGKGRGELGKAASTSAASRARSVPRKSGPADSGPVRNERGVETRNVGGRSFQRQGGAWVDTAYDSSRPTTNVRRGSEQYRTLVADEPGLRSIAEQLGGEVIVVWKSRAYRFY